MCMPSRWWLRLRSENAAEHPDEVYAHEQAAEIRIIGWVFWWSTVRRRRGAPLGR
jgi:phage repressor protein C with HTH and peptisase S24 domain